MAPIWFLSLNIIACCFLGIQEPNVSMIITDYWMPEMTGYDLLRKVKVTKHWLSDGFLISQMACSRALHLTQRTSW
jgi:CheY-like chemotaxis protein